MRKRVIVFSDYNRLCQLDPSVTVCNIINVILNYNVASLLMDCDNNCQHAPVLLIWLFEPHLSLIIHGDPQISPQIICQVFS